MSHPDKEKLICDKRNGCIAVYKESRQHDTRGCHKDDDRNIIYSSKNAAFNPSTGWTMDEETQQIIKDMVDAYNKINNL